ncbi:hypothetical protein [Alkalilacustris brevis]|uniref:hypothetical protein n=1 Tax=Alkalilacustris brevis TaxID=2026338 RepID=UPI001EE4D50E|nr:hypothetical protein [Alkalilacustris brevis]
MAYLAAFGLEQERNCRPAQITQLQPLGWIGTPETGHLHVRRPGFRERLVIAIGEPRAAVGPGQYVGAGSRHSFEHLAQRSGTGNFDRLTRLALGQSDHLAVVVCPAHADHVTVALARMHEQNHGPLQFDRSPVHEPRHVRLGPDHIRAIAMVLSFETFRKRVDPDTATPLGALQDHG